MVSHLAIYGLSQNRTTVYSCYLDFGYLEQPLISKRKSGPYLKVKSGNKILSIRGEIAPREQFLLFSTIFSIYISKLRSLITYSFVKFSCAICFFLNPENLVCRTTDISKCFRGSLQLRDNESRLCIGKVNKITQLMMPTPLLTSIKQYPMSGLCRQNKNY